MRSIWILTLLLGFTASALAQESSPTGEREVQPIVAAAFEGNSEEDKKDELEDLKDRIRELTAQVEALQDQQEKTNDFMADRKLRVSGKVFANYAWNYTGTGDQKNYNGFNIERLYLTLKSDLNDKFSIRATSDIYSSKADANLSSVVIMKYAYLDWQANDWLKVRGGVIPTVWIDYVNKAWGYRGVAKVLADVEKYQSSSDLGVSGIAKLPASLGEFTLSFHNGSGNKKKEADSFKDVSGRLILKPFQNASKALKPLELAGHFYEGRHSEGERRARWGGMAFYKHKAFKVGLNYDARKDSTVFGAGISVFGELKLGFVEALDKFSVIGRWERYDPDTSKPENHHHRQIFGLVYKPISKLALVANTQLVTKSTDAYERYDGTLVDQDGRFELRAIFSF